MTPPTLAKSGSRRQRLRRIAALFVAAAGFASVVSALSVPVRDRLNVLRNVFPLMVPETAAALTAVGGVALLVVARGIRRGQRRAWILCEIVLVVTAVLHLVKGVEIEDALVALAVAGFLWAARAHFRAAADTPRLRGGVLTVATAAALTVTAGALAVELGTWFTALRHPHTVPRLSWGQAFLASGQRMVGIDHVALPLDVGRFFDWAMVAATTGLGFALVTLVFRPVVTRRKSSAVTLSDVPAEVGTESPSDGLTRARAVVARHGSGTLDYFALRSDKQFFFSGSTVIAYAVYGGVCLVSPDPIGPATERDIAWAAFRAFVDRHAWVLAILGAGEEAVPFYQACGMRTLYLGDEAIVPTHGFSLDGGRFKGLRQAVNRVAKYGYTISFHDPRHLDPTLREGLREIMIKSRKGDVERGFSMTLGRIFDPDDDGLLLAVVHAPAANGSTSTRSKPAGQPVAFCQYVPSPGIDGYSLDLMRRDDGNHPNGLIDFAVVETIRHLKTRGHSGLCLNFATMRAVLAGRAEASAAKRALAWVLRRMSGSMQIESLWRFNAKFDPDWQPRYAIYDAPEHALATALAIARAESFWELPVIGRFLTPTPAA